MKTPSAKLFPWAGMPLRWQRSRETVAEAYFGGVPEEIAVEVKKRVPGALWSVIDEFGRKYSVDVVTG